MLIILPHISFRRLVMPLSKEHIRAAAERLHRAEKTRTQIRQLSQEFPAITIEDAYAIQKAWIEIKVGEGRIVKGHKIGLTSKAMQSALNIDEPDSGVLLDDMFFADGGLVPSDRFIATPSPGSPTRSQPSGLPSNRVRSCWRDRSSARSRPARATQFKLTTVPTAR